MPAHFDVTLDLKPMLDWRQDSPPQSITLRVEVTHSVATVRCEAPTFDSEVLEGAVIRATDAVQGMLDCIGFLDGTPFVVFMESYVLADGPEQPIVIADRAAAELTHSFGPEDLEAVAEMVLVEHDLRQVLGDMMLAISKSHYAPIACGRVVDSVRRLITPPGARSESQAWAAMRAALNLDEAYLKFVMAHSKGPRHGHREFVPGPVNRRLLEHAWTTLDRYIAFQRAGRTPLPLDRFPLLNG